MRFAVSNFIFEPKCVTEENKGILYSGKRKLVAFEKMEYDKIDFGKVYRVKRECMYLGTVLCKKWICGE